MLTTIGPDNWKWHQFEKNEIEKIKHVIHKEYCPFNKEWLDHIQEDKTNCLRTVILENGKKL